MNSIQIVRNTLIEVFDELDTWFEKPELISAFKPSIEEWSINENLEHITLTSHFLLIVIENGVAKCLKRAKFQIIPEAESDLEALKDIGLADSFYWHRPEHMIPKSDKPISQIRATMQEQKNRCLDLLDLMPNGEGKLHPVKMSVNQLGKIDMYQWLYFLVLHAKRHLSQIEAVYFLWETKSKRPFDN